jgi:phage-related protein
MYDAGANLIGSIIDGIKSKVSAIGSTMSDVASKIRGYLPFSPAKEGPLSDLNRLDFAGPITDSILGGVPTVQTALDSMLTVNQAQAGFSPNNSQQATNTTLVIQLDGKTISRSVFANMGGVFRVSGAVT